MMTRTSASISCARRSAPLHRVEVAVTGAAGIEHVRTDPPGAILLDLRLPDQSGLEVYQQIRGIDARTPVSFGTMAKGADAAIFRIDHCLGKRPVHNMIFYRSENSSLESFWNRNHVESVQITMAEDFGIQSRGAFYDQTGTIREVVQNHLFQVLANLAMEPPVRTDSESMRDEKVKVLSAIPPVDANNLVRKGSSWQQIAAFGSTATNTRQVPQRRYS